MATVNIGNIKLNWKGAYNGSTAYAIDDVVSYNGSSYVCIQASTGNLPTVTAYWEQMSQKGTDADLINITGTVQGDLYYNNGSAIARLGAGTSGQFLKTQGASANPVWAEAGGKFESQLFHATADTENPSAGTWTKVTLNTILTNEITSASVSSGTISLPAGTYYSHSFSAHYRNNGYTSRLRDTTNGTTLLLGNGGHTWAPNDDATSPNSIVVGRFTLSGTANVEYQLYHEFQNSQTAIQGSKPNHVQLWKIA